MARTPRDAAAAFSAVWMLDQADERGEAHGNERAHVDEHQRVPGRPERGDEEDRRHDCQHGPHHATVEFVVGQVFKYSAVKSAMSP